MEWLCTYWINGVKTRSERQELLSLLCLELSSLLDEDPDEARETIQKADLIKEKAQGNQSYESKVNSGPELFGGL